jgi:hypothetical protein
MLRALACFCSIGALLAVNASAQTCTSPVAFQPPPGGASVTGETCDGDTTATGYCGNFPAPGPAYVFQATFTSARTYTNLEVAGATSAFQPVIYVSSVADGCGTNAACVTPPIPDGQYYIVVTASAADGAGACGSFTLSADGSLPVTLQTFTVT